MNFALREKYRPDKRPHGFSRPMVAETPPSSGTESMTHRRHFPASGTPSRWISEDSHQEKRPELLKRERKVAFVTVGWFVLNCVLVYARATNSWLAKWLTSPGRSDQWIIKLIIVLHASNALSDVILMCCLYYPLRRVVKVFILWNSVTMMLLWCVSTTEIFLTYGEAEQPTKSVYYLRNTTDEGTSTDARGSYRRRAAPYIVSLFVLTGMAALKAFLLVHVYADYLCALPIGSRWAAAENMNWRQGSSSSHSAPTTLRKQSMRRRQGSQSPKRARRPSGSIGSRAQSDRNRSPATKQLISGSSAEALPPCLEHWFQRSGHQQDRSDSVAFAVRPQKPQSDKSTVSTITPRDEPYLSKRNESIKASNSTNITAALLPGHSLPDVVPYCSHVPEHEKHASCSSGSTALSLPFLAAQSTHTRGAIELEKVQVREKMKQEHSLPIIRNSTAVHDDVSDFGLASPVDQKKQVARNTASTQTFFIESTMPHVEKLKADVNSSGELESGLIAQEVQRQEPSQPIQGGVGCTGKDTNTTVVLDLAPHTKLQQQSVGLEVAQVPRDASASRDEKEKAVSVSADSCNNASDAKGPLEDNVMSSCERYRPTARASDACAENTELKYRTIHSDSAYEDSLPDFNGPSCDVQDEATTGKEMVQEQRPCGSRTRADEVDPAIPPRNAFPTLSLCSPIPIKKKRKPSEGGIKKNVFVQAAHASALSKEAIQATNAGSDDGTSCESRSLKPGSNADDANGHPQDDQQHEQGGTEMGTGAFTVESVPTDKSK